MPSDATISMDLIHFDRAVLDTCMATIGGIGGSVGTLTAAGFPMGGGQAIPAVDSSKSKYISLNISSPTGGKTWKFPTAYLMEQPLEFPLGTGRSIVRLSWRAIPYQPGTSEALSANGILFQYTADDSMPLT